jgi:hypothetical protein
MAKAAFLGNNILQVIAGVYLEHKDWRAKEVLVQVNKILASIGLNEISLSTIQRELAKYHKKEREQALPGGIRAIDRIWSIGILKDREYELPSESLPIVLEIANYRIHAKRMPLTIREALWASKLYPVIASFNSGRTLSEIAQIIDKWVNAYATQDLINELLGDDKLETTGLDWALIESRGDYKKYFEKPMYPPLDFKNPVKDLTPEEKEELKQGIALEYNRILSEINETETKGARVRNKTIILKPEEVKNERSHRKKEQE